MVVISCAIPVPPPGGPEDKTPPEVVETVPADSSAGISPDSDIRIAFSEKMTRARLERQVTFYPNVIVKKAKWDGKTIIIEPEQPLHPDTTYIIKLKSGFQDHHRVSSAKDYQFAFATSARIDSGQISGTVYFRRKPTEKGYVHLFVLPKDSSFALGVTRADRETATDENGRYVFHYLPTRDVKFIVWGFQDQSGNARYDRPKEVGELFPDTLQLTANMPILGDKDIVIVDPNEPGEVAGTINNLSELDTVAVSVALYAANDTTPPAYYTRCGTEGAYTFAAVKAGVYALKAFVDLALDSLCGDYPCPQDTTLSCSEPCVQYQDSVRVEPGMKIKLDDLELE
jgi:hypothetical protein